VLASTATRRCCVAMLALSGCTGTARLYEGAPRAPGDVAVVHVGSTVVRGIDGQPRRGGAFDVAAFELPPGPHELTLVFELPARTIGIRSLPAQSGTGTCVLSFEAVAGRQYFLGARASDDLSLHWDGSWQAWVRDPSIDTADDVLARCNGTAPEIAGEAHSHRVDAARPATAPPPGVAAPASAAGETRGEPPPAAPSAAAPATLRLGTWNVRAFGRLPDKDVASIASVIEANFDVLALTEISGDGGPAAYQRLLLRLGSAWGGLLSPSPHPPANTPGSEYYAIVYRRDRLHSCPGWERLRDLTTAAQFVHPPAVGCFAAGTAEQAGGDFLLAAYHATAADGDAGDVAIEAAQLDALFDAMAAARPGEADLIIAGDFNLSAAELARVVSRAAIPSDAAGATLDLLGNRTANRTDHVLLRVGHADVAVEGVAVALDVRGTTASNADFYRTISDHLPIVLTLRIAGSDHD